MNNQKLKHKYHKKAFSLIELSVVLLIIGVILAGITQSSLVVSKYRLNIARSQTRNSPLNSISGIEFWFESTLEESFNDNSLDDGSLVSQWHDINPSNTSPYIASSSGSGRPTYTRNCMSNLPCITFDGTDDYLDVALVDSEVNEFSLFVVVDADLDAVDANETNYVFDTDNENDSDFSDLSLTLFSIGDSTRTAQINVNYSDDGILKAVALDLSSKPRPFLLYSGQRAGDYMLIQLNEENEFTDATGMDANSVTYVTTGVIGANEGHDFGLKGSIGEIIYIPKKLKAQDILDIREYLIQKWHII